MLEGKRITLIERRRLTLREETRDTLREGRRVSLPFPLSAYCPSPISVYFLYRCISPLLPLLPQFNSCTFLSISLLPTLECMSPTFCQCIFLPTLPFLISVYLPSQLSNCVSPTSPMYIPITLPTLKCISPPLSQSILPSQLLSVSPLPLSLIHI